MSTRSGILAGGNWIVDKLKTVDVYPEQDALANIVAESAGNGGSPFNVLVDLAKLGAPFPLAGIGLVGDDADGRWIAAQCRQHRIDATGLGVDPGAPTSYTDVMTVRGTGRRTFFHQRGANALLDDRHFAFEGSRARIFHLGYLLLLDKLDSPDATYGTVAARTLARATEAGFKTSIDVVSEDGDRFPQIVLPALRHVDYCILNEFELERTTGAPVRRDGGIDPEALRAGACRLLEAGVRERVIVHFPEGACAMGRDGRLRTQGSLLVPQGEIVGTVGADDAFAAGALYGLHEEAGIEEALRYGTCAAAACLRGLGTSDGIVPLEECLELAPKFGFRTVPWGVD
jgi:sugar/nucleoside kinase (ribokinase family)